MEYFELAELSQASNNQLSTMKYSLNVLNLSPDISSRTPPPQDFSAALVLYSGIPFSMAISHSAILPIFHRRRPSGLLSWKLVPRPPIIPMTGEEANSDGGFLPRPGNSHGRSFFPRVGCFINDNLSVGEA